MSDPGGEAFSIDEVPSPGPVPCSALRKTFRDGYRAADLRADLLAGTVVGIVALPLSMALAIACGVAPQHGLYTAIVAGAVIAILGGSRVQVSGPTAAFVVILAPIVTRHGLGGLMLASLLAGVFLMLMGVLRLGRLIEFVPYPVTTGFTAGIAVVIAVLQLRDFLGLTVPQMPEHFPEKVVELVRALPTARWQDLAVGSGTLAILILWSRFGWTWIPGPLLGLATAAGACAALRAIVPGFEVATIASRFGDIPRLPPLPALPWAQPGPSGAPIGLSVETLRQILPPAFAIAMLGAIESLLSAVVADGMIRRKHDPNAELLAQGTGNVIAPFFGGIAATGAIARTATNIRSGARSPFAAVFHALFVLLAVLLLAPILGTLPMASLAALLLIVAWNMSEARHVVDTIRSAPRHDLLVLVTCFGLTVVFDMVAAVTGGMLLAAFLFMNRMAEVTGTTLVAEPHRVLKRPVPHDVLVYEIMGPLFFGAAQRAMRALRQTPGHGVRAVLIDLRSVPAIDATGLVNLHSAVGRLRDAGIEVILGGVRAQPMHAFRKAGWLARGDVTILESFDEALDRAIG